METTKVRPLADVMADLASAAENIKTKKKALDDASAAVNKAAEEHDKAQIKASTLRSELEDQLNLLVPSSMQGRVRQS